LVVLRGACRPLRRLGDPRAAAPAGAARPGQPRLLLGDVTATAVESTGKGVKILVPVSQTIDQEHLDDLLGVAASHKPVIGLQGTAWAASARNLPPARRLWHALLVPRLVAPHPNTGFQTVIGPEEAVALLAQGRVRHFKAFSESHEAVPWLDEAGSSRDWRWRFVAALGRLFVQGDRNAVAATITDAPNPREPRCGLRGHRLCADGRRTPR